MSAPFFQKAKNTILNREHNMYLLKKRSRLKNKAPTIISNNCVAGVMYHDLGLKFFSPTINLFFKADDFIRFAEDLKHYLSLELKETESDLPYPVGMIGDVAVYFMHYKTFEEAKEKWEERVKRVDYENLYFVMTEKEECSMSALERYDRLEYNNKVAFTHVPMPQIRCSYYLAGFENDSELGVVTDLKKGFWQRRYIDDYDYVRFLNTGK